MFLSSDPLGYTAAAQDMSEEDFREAIRDGVHQAFSNGTLDASDAGAGEGGGALPQILQALGIGTPQCDPSLTAFFSPLSPSSPSLSPSSPLCSPSLRALLRACVLVHTFNSSVFLRGDG